MRVVVKNKKNISLVFGLIFVAIGLVTVSYLKTDKAASATEFSWVSQAPQRTLSEPYTAPNRKHKLDQICYHINNEYKD